MRARVASRWVSAHSKCEDRYRCNATPSSDRRCRYCALQNIRAPVAASSCRDRAPGRGHDKREQCNHPAPFEWRWRRALHDPFPACENGLCPGDSDSARANRHAGSPTSKSEDVAYLFCSTPAYDVDLTTAVAARQSPELISNERLPMEEAKMKQGRGVIERFREFLPPCKAVISLGEGNTPLVFSPKLSARVGRGGEVFVKNEGVNPTGSFKDRGMTVAVSRAIDRGARSLICASTGNTSASAAAYAARAGIRCAVVLPAGKIATGKLIQAFAHGAKIVAIDGNFDDALRIVRELGEHNEFAIVNSINPDRIDGQKTAAFEIVDDLGDAPDFHLLPVGNAGNITAYWMGYREYFEERKSTRLPRMIGFQAAGAAPIFRREVIADPETVATAIRIG